MKFLKILIQLLPLLAVIKMVLEFATGVITTLEIYITNYSSRDWSTPTPSPQPT